MPVSLNPHFWPIRNKLLLLIFLAFLPAGGIIVVADTNNRDAEIENVTNQAIIIVQSLTAQQDQIAGGTKQMLSTLALVSTVGALNAEACNRLFSDLRERNPIYSVILAATPDGNVFASSKPFAPGSINVADRKYFKDAINNQGFSAGEYIVDRVSGLRSFNFAYPVLDAAKKLKAIVIAGFKLDEYVNYIQKARLPDGCVIMLTDHQGVRLYPLPENRASDSGLSMPFNPFQRISGEQAQGTFEWRGDDGILRLYVFRQVRLKENMPPYLYALVGIPRDKILQKATKTVVADLAFLGIVALLAMLFVLILCKSMIITPINKLVAATQRFGDGEIGVRIGLAHARDELGQLAKSFDDMAALLDLRNIERQNADEALRASEERYRDIFENAVEGIFQSSLEGRFLNVNSAMARMCLYDSPADMISSITDIASQYFVNPEERRRKKDLVEKLGRLDGFVAQVYRKDGTKIWTLENTRAVRTGQDPTIYYEGTCQDITWRKEAEEALTQAEERYRSLFENAVEGIFQSSPDGRFLAVNPALARMAGYDSPEDMIVGIQDINRQLYADASIRPNVLKQIEEQGMVRGLEVQYKRKDGSIFWVSMFGRTVRDSDGKNLRMEGIVEDITMRKRAGLIQSVRSKVLEQLSSSGSIDDILVTLIKHIEEIWPGHPASILLLDKSGEHFINGAAIGLPDFFNQSTNGLKIGPMVGSCGAAAYGRRRVIVSDIQSHPNWESARDLAERAGVAACWSEPILSSRGQVFGTFAVYARHPMVPEEEDLQLLEEIARLAGLVIERSRAVRGLEERESRLRTLGDNLPAGAICQFTRRADGRLECTYASEGIELVTGLPASQILQDARMLYNLLVPEDYQRILPDIEESSLTLKVIDVQCRIHKPDGGERWLNLRSAPRRIKSGDIIWDALIIDITEQKILEQEKQRLFEQTQRDAQTKADLLKEINHRVKNNLIAIMGLLLSEKRHAPAEGRLYVDKTIDHLMLLIDGLLQVHRILSDSEWAPMPLSDLAQGIIGTVLNSQPGECQAVLEVQPSSIEVSPRQANNLALLFNELATNSLKYSITRKEKLKVTVGMEKRDDLIYLEYRDNGPGYPPDVLALERQNIGMSLIRQLITGTLRGTLTLANSGGAVASMSIRAEEISRT
ncbi:MAG: PAS domain S-box protein [Deltaproteobacteria bacterium]|nr:PAS domain S-box protein [Deltaproteobacteria bacterium]